VPEEFDAIHELSILLAKAGARPVVVRERLAPSTLYDIDYHLAIIASAFVIHSTVDTNGRSRMLAPWLKLLQFVALRPRLVPDVFEWARTRRHADLETWSKMPRGYIGDQTHDAVVSFLVAADVLERLKDELVSGSRFAFLENLYAQLREASLFSNERQTLEELRSVRPNLTMLKGA